MKHKLNDMVYAIVREPKFNGKMVVSKHACKIHQVMINVDKNNNCGIGYILQEMFDLYGGLKVYYHYVYEKNVFRTKSEAEDNRFIKNYIENEYFDEFRDAVIDLEESIIHDTTVKYNDEFIQKLEDTYRMFKFPKFDERKQHMQIHIKGDPGNFIPFSMRIHYGTSSYSGKEDEEKGNTIWIKPKAYSE